MENFLQFLASGLLIGGVYAFLALSVVLIFKATGIFNFAVGELAMAGAFMCLAFSRIGVPIVLSIFLAIGVLALLGLLVERLGLRPLIGQPVLSSVMVTLALSEFLKGTIIVSTSVIPYQLPQFLPGGTLNVGGVTISQELLWSFVIVILLCGVFAYFFQRTGIGLEMRGTAEDAQLAQSKGVSVNRVFSLSWAIAAMVACVSGIFLGARVGLNVTMSLIGLKAFPAVIFGGLDSLIGAIIGGLVVGIVETLTGGLIASWMKEMTPFAILLLVLIFKPYGLFGLRRIERI